MFGIIRDTEMKQIRQSQIAYQVCHRAMATFLLIVPLYCFYNLKMWCWKTRDLVEEGAVDG